MPQPQESLELEVKLAVDRGTKAPSISLVDATLSITSTTTHHLSAIYFDTADLRLTRSKITLRRRTGGKDEGWHVKLPSAGGGRRELHVPLGDGGAGAGEEPVPESLLDAVRDIVGDAALSPIARVDNRRVESILSREGTAYAEFCDDHVSAWSYLPGGEAQQWREWELELTDAVAGTETGDTLLRNATEAMLSAGARPADSPSKLVQALGASIDNAPLPPEAPEEEAAEPEEAVQNEATGAVYDSLRAKRDAIIEWEPRVRADEYDAVHQMRVATREMRSLLETFDGVITSGDLDHLEAELKHAAAVLGKARDAEVVEQRLHELIATDESGVIDAATGTHIKRDMRLAYEIAHGEILEMLDSPRFAELLEAVDGLFAPVTDSKAEDDADKQPDDELYSQLCGAFKKLQKRHAKVEKYYGDASLPLAEREAYVHAVRKAAKKLRYAAVAAKGAGLKTGRLVKACKRLQTVLGDFQDSVTAREHLVRLAEQARDRGEDSFAYGVLYQRELEIGRAALEDYPKAMKKVKKAFKKV